MAARKKTADTPQDPALSRYQKFSVERVLRSQIHGAPWNPRTITDDAKKKLKKALKKLGLIQPVIVSRASMTLIGGHQRLDILDQLEGHPDYLLDVAFVDGLTTKDEKNAAILLNNNLAQGDWDGEKLAELLKAGDIEYEDAGFEPMDLELLLHASGIAVELFSDETMPPGLAEATAALQANQSTTAALHMPPPPSDDDANEDDGSVQPNPEGNHEERTAHVKQTKEAMRNAGDTRMDTEHYLILIGKNREDCTALCRELGLPEESKYVDIAKVRAKWAPD